MVKELYKHDVLAVFHQNADVENALDHVQKMIIDEMKGGNPQVSDNLCSQIELIRKIRYRAKSAFEERMKS